MTVLNVFLFEDDAESGASQAMAAFEAQHGMSLPAAYKDFVSRFDDASLYPNLFYPQLPKGMFPNIEDGVFLSNIYGFATAQEMWEGEPYGDATPKGLFFLGSDGGGLEFVMSLRVEDHGKIYCWPHTDVAWGSEGNDNTNLYPQADDFVALLSALTDNAAKEGLDAIGGPEELEDAVQIDPATLG